MGNKERYSNIKITTEMFSVAYKLLELFAPRKPQDGVPVGTVIYGCAVLAGASLFRSFPFDFSKFTPGQFILSEDANEGWPALAEGLISLLSRENIVLGSDVMQVEVPRELSSNMTLMEIQERYDPTLQQIMIKYNLNAISGAFAAMTACAMAIIKAKNMGGKPEFMTKLAISGFVEATKTVPLIKKHGQGVVVRSAIPLTPSFESLRGSNSVNKSKFDPTIIICTTILIGVNLYALYEMFAVGLILREPGVSYPHVNVRMLLMTALCDIFAAAYVIRALYRRWFKHSP